MFIKLFHKTKKKSTAQAMVEFALALPVLLLVIYGLIEVGRLMFIYSSVVTAARQAARYGATTGLNSNGDAFWSDCDGIRAAAKNVGFLQPFADSDIQIWYDGGLWTQDDLTNGLITDPNLVDTPKQLNIGGTLMYPTCDSGDLTGIANGYRVNVVVSTNYAPILNFTPLNPFTISSSSSRTLLSTVSIGATSPPATWVPSSSTLSVVVSPSSFTYSGPGSITINYTITNDSVDTDATGWTFTDSKATGITCSSSTITKNGGSVTCTGTYTVTQTDLDNATVIYGTAYVTDSGNNQSNHEIVTGTPIQTPGLSLTKTPSTNVASNAGDVITYTFTLQNTGNVSLKPTFAVDDKKISSVDCSALGSTLAPSATGTCTGNYTLTKADITHGSFTNTASASAYYFDGSADQQVTSADASATVVTQPLFLTVTASPMTVSGANQTITYQYFIKNTGTTVVTSPSVTDSKVTSISCLGTSIAVGATLECDGTYVTTQTDLDAGTLATTAIAHATSGTKTLASNSFDTSVTVTQSPQLTLTISASPSVATSVKTNVAYTFTLLNSGNTTLSGFSVTDDVVSSVSCNGQPSSLAPGASRTCSGSYTIVAGDITNGSVIDHATASATTGTTTVTSAQATATVITYNGPRLTLTKSANPTIYTTVGQTITYTYTLKNTGNIALTSPFAVTDNKIASVDCSSAASPLAIGSSTTCTGTYTTTL
ncbi:MAG TPA: TadE family protein, partial [Anaerolineales bacterium]|nr:TadE family protein [Anaerolineales bacterium]